MAKVGVRYAVVTLVAAAIYFALSFYLLDPAFVHLPRIAWIQNSFGELAEGLIWAHSAHGLALLVAAIPTAILITLADRIRAIPIAAAAGLLTALASAAPTLLTASVRPYLGTTLISSMIVDGMKFVLLLMLVTWVVTKLTSNHAMQRSSRLGTPLTATATGADREQPASGAPTARRR